MNNKGSSLTPAQALEKLDALYEQSVNALRSAISDDDQLLQLAGHVFDGLLANFQRESA